MAKFTEEQREEIREVIRGQFPGMLFREDTLNDYIEELIAGHMPRSPRIDPIQGHVHTTRSRDAFIAAIIFG